VVDVSSVFAYPEKVELWDRDIPIGTCGDGDYLSQSANNWQLLILALHVSGLIPKGYLVAESIPVFAVLIKKVPGPHKAVGDKALRFH
jgi:hypothetical protein